MVKFLLILCVFLLVEYFFFKLLSRLVEVLKLGFIMLALVTLLSYTFFGYQIFIFDRSQGPLLSFYWSVGFLILLLVPKIIALIMWFLEYVFHFIFGNKLNQKNREYPSRRVFLRKLGLGIAGIPFLGIIHGLWKGKYNFKVLTHQLYFKDLPKTFDGFRVLQISDLHSGSFENTDKIKYAVDLINEQQADLFLFTGDIVNTKAEEFEPWVDIFKGLRSFKFGKFSVLGNHDYGEYVDWETEIDKQQNFEAIKALHKGVNFELLCNENRTLINRGEEIKLIGVENWGKRFKKAGDLDLASKGVTDKDFKILMSHDPSHWEYEVKSHPKNYQLTLSGHTHGLQFGIEIPGFIKWSPIKYVYKQWAGVYKHLNRYINVNRGFGYHAFPGRVGIWPEITIIELRREIS